MTTEDGSGSSRNDESLLLRALEYLAGVAGVTLAPGAALEAVRRATVDLSGTLPDLWRERLIQAGGEVGLRVVRVRASVARASVLAQARAPFLTLVSPQGEEPVWMVLADRRRNRARCVDLRSGTAGRWEDVAEVERRVAASVGAREPEWIVAEPAAPCEGARSEHGDEAPHHTLSPFMRLVGLLRPEIADMWAIVAFSAAVGLLTLATPIAVQQLVNTVAFGGLLQPIFVLAIFLLGFLTFAAVLNVVEAYVVEVVQRRLFVRVVADLAYRLPRVSLSAFDRTHGPELVNRFFDIVTVQKSVAKLLLDGVGTFLLAMMGLLVLAFYHPILLAFDFVMLFAIAFVIFGLGRGSVPTAVAESKAKYAVASWMEEIARHPIAFKSAGGFGFALESADVLAREYLNSRQSHFRVVFRQVIGTHGLQVVANTGILGVGGALVISGQLTLGQLVAAELIVTIVVSSFAKLGRHLEVYYDLLAAVDKLGYLFDLPLEHKGGFSQQESSAGVAVRLRSVGFEYDEDRPILHGVDAELQPGECVALTGPSGSGKTTLVDLLFGLRVPTGGYIELDEVDLRELNLETVRGQMGVVKGFEIIEGTIEDNVIMGRHDVTLIDVRDALERVDLLDDVSRLPAGLQTFLTTGGLPLSLGQARRLMLARALAGRPRLLLLDEALDGLDIDSRDRVLDGVLGSTIGCTTLVVSHSEEVLARCSRTIHIEKSRPVDLTAASGSKPSGQGGVGS